MFSTDNEAALLGIGKLSTGTKDPLYRNRLKDALTTCLDE